MELDRRVTALYEELRMDVHRYLMTIGLPAQAAQDVTQDCFVRLYEALQAGTVVENPRAWLLRVAHNMGINLVTAKGFETAPLDHNAPELVSSVEHSLIAEQRNHRL